MRQRVAIVCPTAWDRKQLRACEASWRERFEPVFVGPEDDHVPATLDVHDLVERAAREHAGALEGATSSSDYPGAVAAALLAERLALPGSRPAAVLEAGHKWLQRQRQHGALPQHTPWTRLLDPGAPETWPDDLAFPCFVKPVRGSFSRLAREVADGAELRAFLAQEDVVWHGVEYVAMHRRLQERLGLAGPDPRCFVAEGLLHGAQVTVEGWSLRGAHHVLGVVDSLMVPGTRAFARFETPSALAPAVVARLEAAALLAVEVSGLTHGGWNVELTHEAASGRIGLIELNPRACGQFADLWGHRGLGHGLLRSLALATGTVLEPTGVAAPWPFAASVPLRTFRPVRVERAPDAARIAAVERDVPGTQVWWECAEGEVLADFDRGGEGQGYRYGVINLGATSRAEVLEKAGEVQRALGARLKALEG